MAQTDPKPKDKIVSLNDLEELSRRLKADNEKIVLCHGVFDLLHMGHVKHFEAAKKSGSVLVVTITADAYVNKGPGRPVFSEHLRAEALANLQVIDFVAIVHAASAEPAIQALKPDLFAKGSDYKDASEDVTGKIIAEQETVEASGGAILFTDEVTFSSSSLINQHLNIYDPPLQSYLDELRNTETLPYVLKALEDLSAKKVLIVGDSIIDEYIYVFMLGKSSKENMIAAQYKEKEAFAGGVFAAANHVASFCDSVEILTSLGQQDSNESLVRDSLRANISFEPIFNDHAPTTRKTRYIDPGYSMRKLFEVYHMNDAPLSAKAQNQFEGVLLEKVSDADVVIVTDFGHGLIQPSTIELLCEHAPFLAVNAQTNSANRGFNLISKYPRADYICIDEPEARLAAQDKDSELTHIIENTLPSLTDCQKIIITQGKHGCLVYERDGNLSRIPAFTNTIVDTVGAGDAFFVVTAPMAAMDMPMSYLGLCGNAAGAMKVGVVGHRTSIEKPAYIKFLTALLK